MKVQKRSITAFIIMVLVLITGCAEQNNGAEAIAPNAASKMIDNNREQFPRGGQGMDRKRIEKCRIQ